MALVAHAFVDGAHLRSVADARKVPWPNPKFLAERVINDPKVQQWGGYPSAGPTVRLARVVLYDACPDDESEASPDQRSYWDAVESLDYTHLAFGLLRGAADRRQRQKAVDTLMAVDMIVGAFTGVFAVAAVIAGDADFVPVVREVQRRGVMVVVAGDSSRLSPDLARVADRVIHIGPDAGEGWFPPMESGGKTWPSGP